MLRSVPHFVLLALAAGACRAPEPEVAGPVLHYVGSSTVANFLRDAEPAYGQARFVLDTESESAGGEGAILEGRADLAGVARLPEVDTLARGVTATLLGYDEIAVVVHPENPVRELTLEELREIASGRIRNWRDVGGEDVGIRLLVTSSSSATRTAFRSSVLGAEDYGPCELVSPDASMIDRVAADPAALGQISNSFLDEGAAVRPLVVDGQAPSHSNADYPITRPLYLLWWSGRTRVAAFIAWTRTAEGRAVFARRFTPVDDSTPDRGR